MLAPQGFFQLARGARTLRSTKPALRRYDLDMSRVPNLANPQVDRQGQWDAVTVRPPAEMHGSNRLTSAGLSLDFRAAFQAA